MSSNSNMTSKLVCLNTRGIVWLLLMCLALSNAQQPGIAEANQWLNDILSGNNNVQTETTTPGFKMNINRSPQSTCTTEDGKQGKCVKPQYCTIPLPATDNTTLFQYRELSCSYLLQCCPFNQLKKVPKETNKLPDGCGWSNPGGYSLRLSPSDPTGFSDFADFPWMVALLTRSYGNQWSPKDYIGGGTLIHPSVVLTTAHKLDTRSASELKCRAGEWDFQSEDEIYEHQDRNVKKLVIHKDFLKLRAQFDAALLFLESPFMLDNVYHIGTACLARDMPALGSLCYTMGWGRTISDGTNTSLLKKIQMPMIDPVTCERRLRTTILGSNFKLHHTLCCAGGEVGKDSCIGDGGSPLVCSVPSVNNVKRYVVYGMVAYGVDSTCGRKDIPGVYAKVSAMMDWIDRQMQGEQLNTRTYNV